MFMPFDKGLKPISDGTPWPIQGAFMSAFFYHTIIHDKTGPIGMISRNIFGTIPCVYTCIYTYIYHHNFNICMK